MVAALAVALAVGLVPQGGPAPQAKHWIGDKIVFIQRQTLSELEATEGEITAIGQHNGRVTYRIQYDQFGSEHYAVPARNVMSKRQFETYWRAWRKAPWEPAEPFDLWDEWD